MQKAYNCSNSNSIPNPNPCPYTADNLDSAVSYACPLGLVMGFRLSMDISYNIWLAS